MSEVWPSRLDHDTLEYWNALGSKSLALAQCDDCGEWIHPPRACCPNCWSDRIGRNEPSGKGTLYSYIVQPTAPGAAASVVGWVELAEQQGLYVVAEIEGMTPENAQIGAPVALDWRESRNLFIPIFRPETDA